MSDTVQFSVVSDPDKWEPAESFQCASQEDAIKAAALFKELHGVIERQAARIAELEKDAARYRWLANTDHWNYTPPPMRQVRASWLCHLTREELDAAIDAAMERP